VVTQSKNLVNNAIPASETFTDHLAATLPANTKRRTNLAAHQVAVASKSQDVKEPLLPVSVDLPHQRNPMLNALTLELEEDVMPPEPANNLSIFQIEHLDDFLSPSQQ